jgi:hypothetical protein
MFRLSIILSLLFVSFSVIAAPARTEHEQQARTWVIEKTNYGSNNEALWKLANSNPTDREDFTYHVPQEAIRLIFKRLAQPNTDISYFKSFNAENKAYLIYNILEAEDLEYPINFKQRADMVERLGSSVEILNIFKNENFEQKLSLREGKKAAAELHVQMMEQVGGYKALWEMAQEEVESTGYKQYISERAVDHISTILGSFYEGHDEAIKYFQSLPIDQKSELIYLLFKSAADEGAPDPKIIANRVGRLGNDKEILELTRDKRLQDLFLEKPNQAAAYYIVEATLATQGDAGLWGLLDSNEYGEKIPMSLQSHISRLANLRVIDRILDPSTKTKFYKKLERDEKDRIISNLFDIVSAQGGRNSITIASGILEFNSKREVRRYLENKNRAEFLGLTSNESEEALKNALLNEMQMPRKKKCASYIARFAL